MTENSIIQWLKDHGHKVLIWLQSLTIFAGIVLWVVNSPDPATALKVLEACIAP